MDLGPIRLIIINYSQRGSRGTAISISGGLQNASWTFQGTTGIRLGGLPCKGLLFAGALGTTGDFMFDFSTGAGVPLAHWDTTG